MTDNTTTATLEQQKTHDDKIDYDADDDDLNSLSTEEDIIDEIFTNATRHIEKINGSLAPDSLLELYGLYKQATIGKCDTTKPGLLNIKSRSKWCAWNALGDMPSVKAKESYIQKVKNLDPMWLPYPKTKDEKTNARVGWVRQSIPKFTEEESPLQSDQKSFADYVREGDVKRVQELLAESVGNKLTDLDDNGMAPIHWACDRNHSEILLLLLNAGSPVDLRDSQKQTGLHYTSSCGHLECTKILLDHGANPNARDSDGLTCKEAAGEDSQINSLFSTGNS